MREFRLVRQAIDNFSLNLRGLTVLTEAANGNFVWTALIAAQAGGDVIAFGRDSIHGSFDQARNRTMTIAQELGVLHRIRIVDNLHPHDIGQADIVTNTGFLRPLDKKKLSHCKKAVAIPLMWETWEFREQDLDLTYCFQQQIPVLGTNENHSELKTMAYVGLAAKKLLLESGVEIHQSAIGLVGQGKFGREILKSLTRDSAKVRVISRFSKNELAFLRNADALVIADHETDQLHIGPKGSISGKRLKEANPDLVVIHISGGVDAEDLRNEFPLLFPKRIAPIGSMSVTTDYVGPKPVIDLHTAGLKVGEELIRARLGGLSYKDALKKALRNPVCQDFSPKQKRIYFTS